MKRTLVVCVITLLTISTFAQNCTFIGHVNSPMAQNKRIFLLNANTGDVLDTVVVADSSFKFTFPVDETFIGYVQVASGSGVPLYMKFIAEPGTIEGDLMKETLSGTPTNDLYDKVLKNRKYEESVLNAIAAEYRSSTYLPKAKEDELRAKAEAQFDTLKQKALQAYQDNKNTAVGALCLEYLIDLNDFDFEELQKMIAAELPIVTTFLPVVSKMSKLEKMYNTSVGKHFVDLDLVDHKSGKTVKLSEYIKGKVAIIDFWASWCRPCRAEIPNVANVYKKYGGGDFVVIGLNVWDEPQRQAQAIKDEKMTWPQLSDSTKEATDTYGVESIPQIMLIDKDGTIIARDLRGDDIEAAVKKALK